MCLRRLQVGCRRQSHESVVCASGRLRCGHKRPTGSRGPQPRKWSDRCANSSSWSSFLFSPRWLAGFIWFHFKSEAGDSRAPDLLAAASRRRRFGGGGAGGNLDAAIDGDRHFPGRAGHRRRQPGRRRCRGNRLRRTARTSKRARCWRARRFDRAGRPEIQCRHAEERQSRLPAPEDRSPPAASRSRSNFDLAQAVRDQAAGADDRTRALIGAEDHIGALRRTARHPQGRCRPICRGGRADGVAATARSDLSRFPDSRAELRQSVGRARKVAAASTALAGTTVHGKISNHRRAGRPPRRESCWCGRKSPIPTRKSCRACSPMSTVEAGKRRTSSSPRRARRSTYSLYGDSVFVVRPDDPAKGFDGPLHVERRFVQIGESREDRVVAARRRRAGRKDGDARARSSCSPMRRCGSTPDKAMKPLPVRPAP